jgi:hypothetical protein
VSFHDVETAGKLMTSACQPTRYRDEAADIALPPVFSDKMHAEVLS